MTGSNFWPVPLPQIQCSWRKVELTVYLDPRFPAFVEEHTDHRAVRRAWMFHIPCDDK